jgi:hypothetical protein
LITSNWTDYSAKQILADLAVAIFLLGSEAPTEMVYRGVDRGAPTINCTLVTSLPRRRWSPRREIKSSHIHCQEANRSYTANVQHSGQIVVDTGAPVLDPVAHLL